MKKKLIFMIAVFSACGMLQAQDYSMATGGLTHDYVTLGLESCLRNGDDVTITYYLTNRTGNTYTMGGYGKEWNDPDGYVHSIVDDLGNAYNNHHITNVLNGEGYQYGRTIHQAKLPAGVTVVGKYTVHKVSRAAKFFRTVRIGYQNPPIAANGVTANACLTFYNLPIYTMADVEEYRRQQLIKETAEIRAKAESGDAEAQYETGCRLEEGRGVEVDMEEAFEWYRKSAEQNVAKAQSKLGNAYRYGFGVAANLEEAFKWHEKAAAQGDADAFLGLGVMYVSGQGVAKDHQKAAQYFEAGASKGSITAKAYLGFMFFNGLIDGKPDYSRARPLLSEAAEKGDQMGQLYLGIMYSNGYSVSQDYGKAVQLFTECAEKGWPDCQNRLANCYLYGKGVKQNTDKAVEWYEKSIAQGNSDGLLGLAGIYDYENFGRQDISKAVTLYKEAADKNNAAANGILAQKYLQGDGVLKNPQLAIEYYEKAAALGSSFSQYRLGMINKENKNYTKALSWFEKAAENGYAAAQYEAGLAYFYAKGTAKNAKKAAALIEKAYNSGSKEAEKAWTELKLWQFK